MYIFGTQAFLSIVSRMRAALVSIVSNTSLMAGLTNSTNSRSVVLETWHTLRSGLISGLRSSKLSNSWTDDAWLLHFDGSVLPADGAISVRAPIPVPMAQVNGDSWQGSTGPFPTGMVAVMSSTQPELTAILIEPVITGDGGVLSFAPGQGLRGLNGSNTDAQTGPLNGNGHAYLYAEISVPAGNATLEVFKNLTHTELVAHGALVGNGGGVITLASDGASQVTGPITIGAGVGAHAAVLLDIDTGAIFDAEVLP